MRDNKILILHGEQDSPTSIEKYRSINYGFQKQYGLLNRANITFDGLILRKLS